MITKISQNECDRLYTNAHIQDYITINNSPFYKKNNKWGIIISTTNSTKNEKVIALCDSKEELIQLYQSVFSDGEELTMEQAKQLLTHSSRKINLDNIS